MTKSRQELLDIEIRGEGHKSNKNWLVSPELQTKYPNQEGQKRQVKEFLSKINVSLSGARIHKCLTKNKYRCELGSLKGLEGNTLTIAQPLEILLRSHFPGSITHDQTDNGPIPMTRPAYGWWKEKWKTVKEDLGEFGFFLPLTGLITVRYSNIHQLSTCFRLREN